MNLIDFINEYPDESSCKAKFKEYRDRESYECKNCRHRQNLRAGNPVNYIDPWGMQWKETDNGYTTSDPDDIAALFEWLSGVMTNLSDSEGSSGGGGSGLFTSFVNFLTGYNTYTSGYDQIPESVIVGKRPLSSAEAYYLVETNKWHAYMMSNMLSNAEKGRIGIAFIHYGHARFMRGVAQIGGDVLQQTGEAISISGYIIAATGLGSGLGTALTSIGNGMKYAGAGMEAMFDLSDGNYRKVFYDVVTNVPMYVIGRFGKYVPEQSGAVFNLILTPFNRILGYGSNKIKNK